MSKIVELHQNKHGIACGNLHGYDFSHFSDVELMCVSGDS